MGGCRGAASHAIIPSRAPRPGTAASAHTSVGSVGCCVGCSLGCIVGIVGRLLGCSHTQASKYVRGLATPTGSFERDLQQLALDPPEHWSYRLRDEVDQARLDHPDRRKKAS